jgi:hypothetical protein
MAAAAILAGYGPAAAPPPSAADMGATTATLRRHAAAAEALEAAELIATITDDVAVLLLTVDAAASALVARLEHERMFCRESMLLISRQRFPSTDVTEALDEAHGAHVSQLRESLRSVKIAVAALSGITRRDLPASLEVLTALSAASVPSLLDTPPLPAESPFAATWGASHASMAAAAVVSSTTSVGPSPRPQSQEASQPPPQQQAVDAAPAAAADDDRSTSPVHPEDTSIFSAAPSGNDWSKIGGGTDWSLNSSVENHLGATLASPPSGTVPEGNNRHRRRCKFRRGGSAHEAQRRDRHRSDGRAP